LTFRRAPTKARRIVAILKGRCVHKHACVCSDIQRLTQVCWPR